MGQWHVLLQLLMLPQRWTATATRVAILRLTKVRRPCMTIVPMEHRRRRPPGRPTTSVDAPSLPTSLPWMTMTPIRSTLIAQRYIVIQTSVGEGNPVRMWVSLSILHDWLSAQVSIVEEQFDLTDAMQSTKFLLEMFNLRTKLSQLTQHLDPDKQGMLQSIKKDATGLRSLSLFSPKDHRAIDTHRDHDPRFRRVRQWPRGPRCIWVRRNPGEIKGHGDFRVFGVRISSYCRLTNSQFHRSAFTT